MNEIKSDSDDLSGMYMSLPSNLKRALERFEIVFPTRSNMKSRSKSTGDWITRDAAVHLPDKERVTTGKICTPLSLVWHEFVRRQLNEGTV